METFRKKIFQFLANALWSNSERQTVKETIRHITKKGRCKAVGDLAPRCLYYRNGNSCAIGRLVKYPEQFESQYSGLSINSILKQEENWRKNFKRRYSHHSVAFLTNLQKLHDNRDFWNIQNGKSELSDTGRAYLREMFDYV